MEVGGALADAGKANSRIDQRVLFCEEEQKLKRLVDLLEEIMDGSKILVFAASKRRCDQLTKELRVDGWPARAIHGDKSQEERDWVLQEFKDGEQPLLIATDVAQRGLDIKEVMYVINYDCPSSSESYVHRIGRTGRAGETGTAYTFVSPCDQRVAGELVKVLRGSDNPVPRELEQLAARAAREARYGR
jgi:ATP-dependent RNA helicase DDX5/DBP2